MKSMSEENRDPEIRVTDRRRFSPEGEPLDPAETEPEQTAQAPIEEPKMAPPMPPASFEFLVISLR